MPYDHELLHLIEDWWRGYVVYEGEGEGGGGRSVKRKTRYASDVVGGGLEILVGPRGGSYYIDEDGTKVYLVSRRKPNRNYTPPPGSFSRYLQNQI